VETSLEAVRAFKLVTHNEVAMLKGTLGGEYGTPSPTRALPSR
jgi:hypothetical protein